MFLKKTKVIIFKLFITFQMIYLFSSINNFSLATSSKEFTDIKVPAAVVMDFESGRILFEKNANEQRKMASLTKIMTSILLVENCNLDELIEVPKEAAYIGGSTVGLKKGDKVTARSLLYGMLLPSGNDCAVTVAIHLGGTIENFAKMMTNKAIKLGLTDTSFANPHGLDADTHYTSARSMAIITRYALNNKYINEIVNTKTATINFGSFTKTLNNTNALLSGYDKADGVKTGFTNGANRCLAASASNGTNRYIAVVLGAETTKIRFSETRNILEKCFERYIQTDISKYLNFYINIPIIKGSIPSYERKISDNLSLPLTAEEYEKIYVKQEIVQNLTAPVNAGEKLGKITVLIEDEVLYEKEVYLEENIYKKTVVDYIIDVLSNIFSPIEMI